MSTLQRWVRQTNRRNTCSSRADTLTCSHLLAWLKANQRWRTWGAKAWLMDHKGRRYSSRAAKDKVFTKWRSMKADRAISATFLTSTRASSSLLTYSKLMRSLTKVSAGRCLKTWTYSCLRLGWTSTSTRLSLANSSEVWLARMPRIAQAALLPTQVVTSTWTTRSKVIKEASWLFHSQDCATL